MNKNTNGGINMYTKRKKLICVVGESCSGKDTIVKEASKYLMYGRNTNIRLKPIVSYATRPIRENETNGVEHWFITENEAKEITGNNKLLAYTYIKDPNVPERGYEYFTTLDQLDDCNLYIIDPRGIDSLVKYVHNGEIDICIIFIDCPKFIRDMRAKKRKDKYEAYKARCANERHQFKKFRRVLRVNGLPNAHIIHSLPGMRQKNLLKFCDICINFLK